jgi:hypothetical protein
VHFGQTSAPDTVSLTNGSASKLTIKSAGVGLINFALASTTCPSALNVGQSCNYVLNFRPLTTGIKNEVFKVNDSSATSPQQVQLHGVCNN